MTPSRHRLAFALATACVLATAAALAPLVRQLAEPRAWLEIAVCTAILAVVLLHRDVRAALGGMSVIGRTACAVFLLLLLAGQAIHRHRVTYPFVGWSMYSTPHAPEYLTYMATLADGTEIPFPFHAVAPTTDARAFAARFSPLLPADPGAEPDNPLLEDALIALSHAYNRRRARVISQVVVSACEANLDQGRVAARVRCTERVTLPIPAPPGSPGS